MILGAIFVEKKDKFSGFCLASNLEDKFEGLNATIIEHETNISHLEDKFDTTNITVEEQNEVILKVKKQISCPTENTYYRWISGRCYYLDIRKESYEKAKKLCAETFVGGKLFEPENLSFLKIIGDIRYQLKVI